MRARDFAQRAYPLGEKQPNHDRLHRAIYRAEARHVERGAADAHRVQLARGNRRDQLVERAHLSGQFDQAPAETRRIVALEHRQQIGANPIAQNIARRIRRVLDERNRARGEIVSNLGARKRQHRTNQASRPALGHRRQSGCATAAHQTHQHSLSLIIAMVSQRDKISLNAIRNAQQKLAPNIARPLLEVRGRSRHVEPVSALDDQLNPEPRAHRTYEVFIAIRLGAANPMVQMRRHDPKSQMVAKLKQRAGKRDGISAAG